MGTLANFSGFRVLASLLHRRRSVEVNQTSYDVWTRLLGWYTIYTLLGRLPPNGILSGVKFTLRPSLAFSYIGSVTARHSSSQRQPNFAAWYKGWNYRAFAPRHFQQHHLYSVGRPSRFASAHTCYEYKYWNASIFNWMSVRGNM